jgi:hypothetical protein
MLFDANDEIALFTPLDLPFDCVHVSIIDSQFCINVAAVFAYLYIVPKGFNSRIARN